MGEVLGGSGCLYPALGNYFSGDDALFEAFESGRKIIAAQCETINMSRNCRVGRLFK
jgi:hypothetical protein